MAELARRSLPTKPTLPVLPAQGMGEPHIPDGCQDKGAGVSGAAMVWGGTSGALALDAPLLAPGAAPCCASSNFPLFTRKLAAGPSRTWLQGLEPCRQQGCGAEGSGSQCRRAAGPWGHRMHYLWDSRAVGLSR